MGIKVGQPAPSFDCEALVGGKFENISLEGLRGKWVVLFFYPLDFTFVCPTEIMAFNEAVHEFEKLNAQVVASSTDSVFSHLAWSESHPGLKNLAIPVLGDTAHAVARAYGVLIEDKGIALRGTFVIDPEGTLQWVNVNALNVGRSVDEVLRVLEALHTGGLTPCGWQPGEATLNV